MRQPPPGGARGVVTGHTSVPRAKQDPYRTAPTNYVQLLQHITRARDVTGLSLLVKRYGRMFDAVHVAAAFSKLPKLHQPAALARAAHLNPKQRKDRKQRAARLLAHLQVMANAQVPRMFARQVAAITYVLSRCGSMLPTGSSSNPATQQLLHSMLSRMIKDNGRLLWQGASGTSVAYLLHGLARVGYPPSGSSSGDGDGGTAGVSQHGDGAVSAARAASTATQQLCSIIARHPDRLHVRELATAAWALGRMHKRRPGLAGGSTQAALDAISREVQQRKLYLRPTSMVGLATACAWLSRRDTDLLAAIAEEAVEQAGDLRPPHLAVLAWACARLKWQPPPGLLAAINAQAGRQLAFFDATSLGLLLHSMRGLGALDEGLLAQVAAGIAAEQQVRLLPRDAARILAAFVAAPRAGSLADVEGMAERIGGALRRSLLGAPPGVVADLLVCYSKLPYHHPLLLRLLGCAVERGPAFSLGHWVKALQAAARLGYGRVAADPALEARLAAFYEAADQQLQQHLRGAALPAAAAAAGGGGGAALTRQAGGADQQDGEQAAGGAWWQRLAGRRRGAARPPPRGGGGGDQQAAPPLHRLRFDDAVDLGLLLSERGALSTTSAGYLADVGAKLLPHLKLRKLWMLLAAVTGRDRMLAQEDVRALLAGAVRHLQGADLSSAAVAPTVLVGLTVPLARAVARNMVVGSGEQLLQSLYDEVAPALGECSQAQVLALWEGMRAAGVAHDTLHADIKALAAARAWQLPSSGFLASHAD